MEMGLPVLIVDDEAEFAETLAERLRLRGFTPHVANSGEEALSLVARGVANIMLLDLKMPGMDGLEVLRRIQKGAFRMQVIILTGHGSEIDEVYARSMGAIEYLRKPADLGAILAAFKKAEKELNKNMPVLTKE
ncbi:MAG: response regulator [Syntrophobacter sp.]